ncbi:protein CLAVATA 3 isoform X2 [Diospyros lotus]|uniref:protein CLAVATA 3 isoform X2 n=1 Tax=Diospyros lotus TaxID=55363 RepID=UPI00225091C9|nr:protein CLAVATA 3 isoform X2 [Diospyros lotus]
MDSALKFARLLIFTLLLCLLLTRQTSECYSGRGGFYAKAAAQLVQSRKVLYSLEAKRAALETGNQAHGSTSTSSYGNGENFEELRKVPSGPDPLHHNGGSPKKPRTTP